MNLKVEISKLVKLQKIDSEIQCLKNKMEVEKPKELDNLKNKLLEKKKKIEAIEKELKDLQLKQKNKELDLSSKEETIKKTQTQLYQLKTNKEYQAKLLEIASLKADVSVLEEELLCIFDGIEEVNRKLKIEKEALLKEEKEIKIEEEKINSSIKEIASQIKELEQKRAIFIKEINPNILNKYENLLESRSGIALASVYNENCGVCHMYITPQTINEIKMYKDLILCGNCVRILYIPEDIVE